MWTPESVGIGQIYKIDSIKHHENVRDIKRWSTTGGVLLLGYERFRSLITKSMKAKEKHGEVSDDLESILLNEPSLVIADEAHTLKNAKSAVAKIAQRLKTKSRIALTGSPLNNHLEEYHTIVDWIAPGYLGSIVQFRDRYSEPIERGLYADSTASDKRTSIRKLHILKRDLDPKNNRADISAIEKDMPSKTEYFITVPLTELQREAYDIFVASMLQSVQDSSTRGGNAAIWDWIAMLGWLCHHPSGFVRKLEERQAKKIVRTQTNSIGDSSESSDETPVPEDGATTLLRKSRTTLQLTSLVLFRQPCKTPCRFSPTLITTRR